MDTNGRCDKDPLGTRIKEQYENRTRYMLPRRTYTIIRLDGKAFHTYTRGLQKPFDAGLFEDIDTAIKAMLPELQGAVFAYTQSDEISVLLTDFADIGTCAWFDGNLQKMCSVAASIMTAEFNKRRYLRNAWGFDGRMNYPPLKDDLTFVPTQAIEEKVAYFDARVFTIPDRIEVMNYFIWRNQDCARNSVSMVAQSLYSHKELHGKSTADKHEMIHQAGKNWATDYTDGEKNGRLIVREKHLLPTNEEPKVELRSMDAEGNVINRIPLPVYRTNWVSTGAWKFTEDKDKLLAMIPEYPK